MLDDEEEFSAASFSKYRNQRAEEMKATHDEDDELRAILAEQKKVKGDSLASTRNALKQVKETEVVGTKTMNKLAQQTGKHPLLKTRTTISCGGGHKRC